MINRRRTALFFVAIASVGLLTVPSESLGIVIRHDVTVDIYEAIGRSHAEAGYWGLANDGPECSGVLVTPTKVLTAAHCVPAEVEVGDDGVVDARFAAESFFALGDIQGAGFEKNVLEIRSHPDWQADGALGDANDLAILTLSQPFVDVQPASISLQNPDELVGTMVGYGFFGNGKDGIDAEIVFEIRDDETEFEIVGGVFGKRGARNILHVVEPNEVPFLSFQDRFISYDFDSPNDDHYNHFEDMVLPDEGAGTFGDSGGPLYATFANGTFLVAITSGGDLPPHLYPDEITPEFQPNDYIGVYGSVGGYAMLALPSNVTFLRENGIPVVPEPHSGGMAIIGIASLLLSMNLRRRNDALRDRKS